MPCFGSFIFLNKQNNYQQIVKSSPQICFFGKSNVGKSTFLNLLMGQKLAYTSKFPGRTQFLNYFFSPTKKILFVDLPGIGYAATSFAKKDEISTLLTNFFSFHVTKNLLKGICFLHDGRRKWDDIEINYLNYLMKLKTTVLVIYTKSDKYTQHDFAKIKKHHHLIFPLVEYCFMSNKNKQLVTNINQKILALFPSNETKSS